MYYPAGYNRSLMIVLLVAYIVQVDRCSADDATADATSDAADATAGTPTDAVTAAAANATAGTATDAATAAAANATAGDGGPSTLSKCKTELYKSIADVGKGTGMMLKAIGHAAMAVMGVLFGAVNGIASTTAATGEKVAAGVSLVNNAAGSVVLVRDVTSGAAAVATGLAATYRQNAEHNIKNRQQMFDAFGARLDNYHPESETFLTPPVAGESGADGKTTDTTAAAAADAAAASA